MVNSAHNHVVLFTTSVLRIRETPHTTTHTNSLFTAGPMPLIQCIHANYDIILCAFLFVYFVTAVMQFVYHFLFPFTFCSFFLQATKSLNWLLFHCDSFVSQYTAIVDYGKIYFKTVGGVLLQCLLSGYFITFSFPCSIVHKL